MSQSISPAVRETVVKTPPGGNGLFHIYSKQPTSPGDRALCGYIKQHSGRMRKYGAHPDLCVVCSEIAKTKQAAP